MKKRVWSFVLAAVLVLGLLSGCGGSGGGGGSSDGGGSGGEASDSGKVLNIYVWNQEFQEKFNDNYPEVEKLSSDKSITYLKDGTEVHWIVNPNQDGVYQQKLDEALPISQLGITTADVPNQYKYTQEAVTTADGEIRALSYQATPGMMVYRRSIAQAVLGTDDPDTVAAAVADWDKFYETAGQMKAAGYYMYSGRADTYRVYSNNVSAPWVDGNTVVVDQSMMTWVERSMKDTQEGINHNVTGQWIDEWNKDMGPDSKVFCFFLPAWGLDVCIKPNVEGTSAEQDWAVCPSPQGFYWGGTWLIAANGTDNMSQVKDIMLKMTSDRDILRNLAVNNGEMSNDQPLMEELAQSPEFGIDLLGGQNYLGVLSDAAASISLANVSPYDQGCTEEFQNTFGDYFNGKIDLEKAKANFEVAIGERYPELKSGGVRWPS